MALVLITTKLLKPRFVTAEATARMSDDVILLDSDGGAFTLYLPDPTAVAGKHWFLKRTNGGPNDVTIRAL